VKFQYQLITVLSAVTISSLPSSTIHVSPQDPVLLRHLHNLQAVQDRLFQSSKTSEMIHTHKTLVVTTSRNSLVLLFPTFTIRKKKNEYKHWVRLTGAEIAKYFILSYDF